MGNEWDQVLITENKQFSWRIKNHLRRESPLVHCCERVYPLSKDSRNMPRVVNLTGCM